MNLKIDRVLANQVAGQSVIRQQRKIASCYTESLVRWDYENRVAAVKILMVQFIVRYYREETWR